MLSRQAYPNDLSEEFDLSCGDFQTYTTGS